MEKFYECIQKIIEENNELEKREKLSTALDVKNNVTKNGETNEIFN
jgi:hypothetical protein